MVQWSTRPESRKGVADIKSRVEHPLPGFPGGVTSNTGGRCALEPLGAGRWTHARTPDAAFEWSQEQRPCPAPPTLELSPRIESQHAAPAKTSLDRRDDE